MKKFLVYLIIIIMIITTSCSSKTTENMNLDEIKINILNQENSDLGISYFIEVKNNSDFIIKHVSLFLSYPINKESRENPYKVEESMSKKENIIKPEEVVKFYVFTPLKEAGLDTYVLNIEHPSIKLKGYYISKEKEEIPFAIGKGS